MKKKHKATTQIGFIDDNPQFIESIRSWQRSKGKGEFATTDSQEVLRWVKDGAVGTVVVDLRMPGLDGVSLLERVKEIDPKIDLVLLTSFDPSTNEKGRLARLGVRIESKTGDLPRLLEELDSGASMRMEELQTRVEMLQKIHEMWIADLVEELNMIPAIETLIIGSEEVTIADILEDIKTLTPRGIEFIHQWRKTVAALRRRTP